MNITRVLRILLLVGLVASVLHLRATAADQGNACEWVKDVCTDIWCSDPPYFGKCVPIEDQCLCDLGGE
jgi:hypothetical protein